MKYRNPRARLGLTVGVLRNGQRELAYVLDISEGGLQMQGLRSPAIGEILRIHAKGAIIQGRIMWARGAFCGVQFCETQAPGDLKRFMAALPRLNGGARKARPVFQEYGALQGR